MVDLPRGSIYMLYNNCWDFWWVFLFVWGLFVCFCLFVSLFLQRTAGRPSTENEYGVTKDEQV